MATCTGGGSKQISPEWPEGAWVPSPVFHCKGQNKAKHACVSVEYDNGISTTVLNLVNNSCNAPILVIEGGRSEQIPECKPFAAGSRARSKQNSFSKPFAKFRFECGIREEVTGKILDQNTTIGIDFTIPGSISDLDTKRCTINSTINSSISALNTISYSKNERPSIMKITRAFPGTILLTLSGFSTNSAVFDSRFLYGIY